MESPAASALVFYKLIDTFLFPNLEGLLIFGIDFDADRIDRKIVVFLNLNPILFNCRIDCHDLVPPMLGVFNTSDKFFNH
jgi:hypothetical protein